MKSNVCVSTIGVLLIACSVSLNGQQASSAERRTPSECSGQSRIPAWLVSPLCRLLLPAQARQLSSDVPREDKNGGTLTTFQIPGQNLVPTSINDAGTIAGMASENLFEGNSFLRTSDGTIIAFNPPGALSSEALAINSAGSITGVYFDQITAHGFVRDPQGNISSFDVPGACATEAAGINPSGTITGYYLDADCVTTHGFVRYPDGTYSSFDVPGQFDFSSGAIIDPRGEVAGAYFDSNVNHTRGYLRKADGTVTLFDGPSTCYQDPTNLGIAGIDAAGVIAGGYRSSDCVSYHGLLRYPDGTLTTSDLPGSGGSPFSAIAANGAAAGAAFVGGEFVGFLRNPGGQYTIFTLPGYFVQGTNAAVNSAGAITGVYLDLNQQNPWFPYVWTPN